LIEVPVEVTTIAGTPPAGRRSTVWFPVPRAARGGSTRNWYRGPARWYRPGS